MVIADQYNICMNMMEANKKKQKNICVNDFQLIQGCLRTIVLQLPVGLEAEVRILV
jgi:hypothetical protein